MTDTRRRSIVFNNIDDSTWNRFKGKVGGDGRQIQELVLSWISAYIDPKEEPAPEPGVVSRTRRQLRAGLETVTREEPGAEADEAGPGLPTLEEAGIGFKNVEIHAGHLGLDIGHMTPEQAAVAVLDGIFHDYVRNHEKLSAEAFDDYKEANDPMLCWYNANKSYGAEEEGEEEE